MSNYRPYRSPGINPLWVIIGVNVVIFLATLVNRDVIYLRFGFVPADIGKQPWTILTYMFVHDAPSPVHVLFNMVTLYFFGTFVMSLIGETAFLITYFVGGIVGGLFFWFLSPIFGTQFSLVIGASGAIYALGGLLMVMRPSVKVMTFPIPVPMPLWVAILGGFILVSFFPGVAWEAHLGGIAYGAAVGYFFRRREFRRY